MPSLNAHYRPLDKSRYGAYLVCVIFHPMMRPCTFSGASALATCMDVMGLASGNAKIQRKDAPTAKAHSCFILLASSFTPSHPHALPTIVQTSKPSFQ